MRTLSGPASLLVCLCLLACGGGGGGGGGDCTTTFSGTDMSTAEANLADELLVLVNQERSAASLDAVITHRLLKAVAFEHSWDMATRGFFDHVNPCGESPSDRVSKLGVGWTAVAENIAQGQTTALEVITAWMGSSEHRANILDDRMTNCGIGVYQGAGDTWWTLVLIQQ